MSNNSFLNVFFFFCSFLAVKLIGKLGDGTVFLKKGHGEGEEPFEFKTDEGIYYLHFCKTSVNFSLDVPTFIVLIDFTGCFLTEQVIDGLDKAVLKMKKGEVALVTIDPEYAFGSTESKQELAVVPPNSTLYYEVDLVSFDKVSSVLDVYASFRE